MPEVAHHASPDWPQRVAATIAGACFAAAIAAGLTGFAPAFAADPSSSPDNQACCGVPPRSEVTADHVFGRWVVMRAPIGMGLRPGDTVEFRRDGTVSGHDGPCRFAVLRAEMTIDCAEQNRSGAAELVDDTKLLWRQDGNTAVFIAPLH